MSTVSDPLQYLKETVDASKARVCGFPSRIWLFGGPFATTKEDQPASVREAFSRAAFKESYPWLGDLACPEDFPEWIHFSGYEDLLLFERDAGFLSRAIVLFSESPGAIAELGAFALDEQLHKRLFVVISQKFREHPYRKSFLNLGPIKRIERAARASGQARKSICVIETDKPNLVTDSTLNVIFSQLDKWLKVPTKTEYFRKENPTHTLLLMADLVDLHHVLSESQLGNALSHFGVEDDQPKLQRLVSLLDLMGLIKVKERGSDRFLLSGLSAPLLEYDAVTGRRFERLSFKTKIWDLVQRNPDLAPLMATP